MARRNAFVAKIAVDLEHLLQAADDQPLEIELGRDAQIQIGVERVVMRHERPRRGAPGDRVHHRRLDLEVAPCDEELANGLHDLRASHEHTPRLGTGDQVDVTLPVLLLLIGKPVEFLRQRPQRLGEQPQLGHPDRQLSGAGLEKRAAGADDVAQVPMLERIVDFRADGVAGNVELYPAAHVLQRGEARLAHDALQHHPARYGHREGLRLQRFVGLSVMNLVQRTCKRIAAKVVRIRLTALAQRPQLRAPLGDDLVLVVDRRLRVARVVHFTPPASGSPR